MANTPWRALVSGTSGLAAITLASGVGLQAMETFIGSTLLPSVVRDIGGLEPRPRRLRAIAPGTVTSLLLAAWQTIVTLS